MRWALLVLCLASGLAARVNCAGGFETPPLPDGGSADGSADGR